MTLKLIVMASLLGAQVIRVSTMTGISDRQGIRSLVGFISYKQIQNNLINLKRDAIIIFIA